MKYRFGFGGSKKKDDVLLSDPFGNEEMPPVQQPGPDPLLQQKKGNGMIQSIADRKKEKA